MPTFHARARTVDMLGRQQIAGIPTAVSELFKNAYDAYADNVVADFLRSRGAFILRDDGMGMRPDEFEDRWLTLGTESKLDPKRRMPTPVGKRPRPILGEKGIGRLAIAALGPQVLVLSQSSSSTARLVAALIDWRFFEIPGVNLDEIEVPIITLSRGNIPGIAQVRRLAKSARTTAVNLRQSMPKRLFDQIVRDLERFDIDPVQLADHLSGPDLRVGSGTHFYITPVDESLAPSIDGDPTQGGPSSLVKTLIGFANTMTPGHPRSVIRTRFYDHRSDADATELIGPREFFQPQEFESADHHLSGAFDKYGTFRGDVNVYHSKSWSWTLPWRIGTPYETECGPFRINIAVVQGKPSESRLPPSEWAALAGKMDLIGGLYIYNDNVRVLPYGNADYDFLEIERDRSKRAGTYYFSYRRMFGVVQLTRKTNPNLQEKAGREGFRENLAYRQFRAILKNFFVQAAAEYFKDASTESDFGEIRSELERAFVAKRELERQHRAQRQQLKRELSDFFTKLTEGVPAPRIRRILLTLDSQLAAIKTNSVNASTQILRIEEEAIAAMGRLKEEYTVDIPHGVGLDRDLRADVNAYRRELEHLNREVFVRGAQEIHEKVEAATKLFGVTVSAAKRVSLAVEREVSRAMALLDEDQQEISVRFAQLSSRVADFTAAYKKRLSDAVRSIVAEVASGKDRTADVAVARLAADRQISAIALDAHRTLSEVRSQLTQVEVTEDGRPGSSIAAYEALETELLELRDRSEDDLELAQLGMAVRVINHEFDASVRSIRSGLRQLRPWAKSNDKLDPIYRSLVTSFEHLDAYLNLFTPLQRRLYRKAVVISGGEILSFLADLFSERFAAETIVLRATSSFKRYQFEGIPSSFYPVFVNVVDNAVHWLRQTAGKRTIELDVESDIMYISNSGPSIDSRDQERVFEYGFSRKTSGQGLGLYISRQVLRKQGYDLLLMPPRHGSNVTFAIRRGAAE